MLDFGSRLELPESMIAASSAASHSGLPAAPAIVIVGLRLTDYLVFRGSQRPKFNDKCAATAVSGMSERSRGAEPNQTQYDFPRGCKTVN